MSNKKTNIFLDCCLYFTANALSRTITKMAEEEFAQLRVSPSHAFMLMLIVEKPGITQKELAKHLHLAQSTVSRFADKLVQRKYAQKKVNGKLAQIFPTEEGKKQLKIINESWRSLFNRYSEILGKEEAEKLTSLTNQTHLKLEESLLIG